MGDDITCCANGVPLAVPARSLPAHRNPIVSCVTDQECHKGEREPRCQGLSNLASTRSFRNSTEFCRPRTAPKLRAFSGAAPLCTRDLDSVLEEARFELLIPQINP